MLISRSLVCSLAMISLAAACSSSGVPKDPIASPPAQPAAADKPPPAADKPPAPPPRPDPDLARDQEEYISDAMAFAHSTHDEVRARMKLGSNPLKEEWNRWEHEAPMT